MAVNSEGGHDEARSNLADPDRWTERARESTAAAGDRDEPALPLDTTFELLSNRRRRAVCRYLADRDDGVRLGTLAEHIAAAENDCPVSMVSSNERKRVYVGLYQCHLPKLDDAGVVGFDSSRKTVEAGPYLPTMSAALGAVEAEMAPRSEPETGSAASLSSLLRALSSFLS